LRLFLTTCFGSFARTTGQWGLANRRFWGITSGLCTALGGNAAERGYHPDFLLAA
jgi:hypothetical protein